MEEALWQYFKESWTDNVYATSAAKTSSSPVANGGNPKISDVVFFSADYSSLGCI